MEDKYHLIVGTYTDGCPDSGIYVYQIDCATLDITLKGKADAVVNPSFMSMDKANGLVYCVSENGTDSTVSTFTYEINGQLKYRSKVPGGGEDPCYITHSKDHVIVANYESGSIAVFGRQPDGTLTEAVQVVRHEGSGPDKPRQAKPHVHLVQFSPDGRFLFATDLGTDSINIYKYDSDGNPAVLSLEDTIAVTAGSGPRHLAFHPEGNYFYLICELSATVEAFSYDGDKAKLLQRVALEKEDRAEYKSGADVKISGDGRFLYATNRGKANTITVFKITDSGNLRPVQQLSTQGNSPRNIAIDPTGRSIFIAHEDSGGIVIFSRDRLKGTLSATGKTIDVCKPVFLNFVPTGADLLL
jgi:6-phosphogluconolactonase